MTDRPIVRAASPADLVALLGLYRELAEDRASSLPTSLEGARPLLEAIARQAGRALLVAELSGLLVGTADLLIAVNLTHGGKPWAIVENVVVAEAYRQRGVGSALMDDVVRRCREAGCYKIQLLSRRHRRDAHRFYRDRGFESTAEGFRLYLEPAR